MRVETKMTNRKEFDIKPYASIENASKCFDNADRLLDDAFKTSLPTRVALMELGIEELSKGLIILLNIDKPPEKPSVEKLMGNVDLQDKLWIQWHEEFTDKISIQNINLYDHKEKLKAIKLLFKFASKNGEHFLDPDTIESLGKFLKGMNFGDFNLPTSTELVV